MPSIEWRSKNTCRVIVSIPKAIGKGYDKVWDTLSFPPTMSEKQMKKEAEKAALLFENKVKSGNHLDGEKLTLAEFSNIWLRDYAEPELAPGTLVKYKMRLESRILPALGHMTLARIQPSHITAFYNNLKEAGIRMDVRYLATEKFLTFIKDQSSNALSKQIGVDRHVFTRLRDGKAAYYNTAQKISAHFDLKLEDCFAVSDPDKVLSFKSIRHHHTLLSGMLSCAMQWNLLKDNPCQRVKLPSVTKAKSAPANYCDDKEVLTLLAALEDEPIKYRTIICLAIDTGLRLSEVAGLTWDVIDFAARELRVVKQRQYVETHGVIECDPKTESGIRPVTISNHVIERLLTYKEFQENMRTKCGTAWHESDYVFTHEDGKPIFPRRPSAWFSQFVKRKGLPHVTFHGLRHTNASLMFGNEVDVVTLAGRLGHSDKTVTLNMYAHMIKSREKRAANMMDKFYTESTGKDT